MDNVDVHEHGHWRGDPGVERLGVCDIVGSSFNVIETEWLVWLL